MDKRTISKYGWIIIAIIAIVAVIAIAIPVAELVKGGTSNSVDKYYEPETNTPGNGDININRPSSEKYIITYIPNCDDIVIPNDEYSEENPVVLPKPTRDHYWFEGWYENSDLSGDPVITTQGSSGDKTYYGKWKPKKYTITYNTGTDDIVIPNGSYDVENPVLLPVPEREGYDFEGWYEDPSFPGDPITSTENAEGDKEYHAKWKAHTYTIVYNANGGVGEMASSSHTYDISAALNKNTFTRTNYLFIGWATSPTGIKVYSDEQFVKNLTSADNDSITLFAVWEEISLQVEAEGYTGTYDGKAHSIKVTIPSGATITYAESENGSYSSINPSYTDAGTYMVYYKVTKTGYENVTGSAVVKINKAAGKVTLSANSGTYVMTDYDHSFEITENLSGGKLSISITGDVDYSLEGTTVHLSHYYEVGTATITVISAETQNYLASSAAYEVSLVKGKTTPEVSPYEGIYDGKSHSITVGFFDKDVDNAGDFVISYATSEKGPYSETHPSCVNAGTYTIYFKIVSDCFEDIYGSSTVTIKKAPGKVTLSVNSGTYVMTDYDHSFEIMENLSGGDINISIAGDIVDYLLEGTTVHLSHYYEVGTATITVTSAETQNYLAASATYEVTVVKDTDAEAYADDETVVYNGKKHGININYFVDDDSAEYEFYYATSEDGPYSTTEIYYVDAGTYTIYFKVVSDVYEDVYGSATVTIKKAPGKVTLSSYSDYVGYPDDIFFDITENLSGGALNIEIDDEDVVSAVLNGTEVRISAGSKLGETTITVTSAETKNYLEASAVYVVENTYTKPNIYAVYSADDNSLRFYYTPDVIKQGAVYNNLTSTAVYTGFETAKYTSAAEVPWYSYRTAITSVHHADTTYGKITPVSMAYWFYEFKNCSYFALDNFDASNVESMKYTFAYALENNNGVPTVAFSTWNTSNVKDMSYMFYHAFSGFVGANNKRLNAGVEKWNISNVEYMTRMFYQACYSGGYIESFNLYSWNPSKLINADYMFYQAAYNNTNDFVVDISDWSAPKLKSAAFMFKESGYKASEYTVYAEYMYMPEVTTLTEMFYSAARESTGDIFIGISGLDAPKVTNTNSMFAYSGYSAADYNVSAYGLYMPKVTSLSNMFLQAAYNATGYACVDISESTFSSATSAQKMFNYFGYNAAGAIEIYMYDTDINSVTTANQMFCYVGYNAGSNIYIDLDGCDTSALTNMSYMFYAAGHESTGTFEIVGLGDWDTSNVTTFESLFEGTGYKSSSWTAGSLAEWDTSSATNMVRMFAHCARYMTGSWTVGDLSGWDMSNVENTQEMFSHAGAEAQSWNVGLLADWDVSKVENMQQMFHSAGYNAERFEIDVSKWNVSRVITFEGMFRATGYGKNADTISYFSIGDLSTKKIELDNGDWYMAWDVSNAINMTQMFRYVGYTYRDPNTNTWGLGDISNWDVSNVEFMDEMFMEARDYQSYTLDLSKWTVDNVITHENFNFDVEGKVLLPKWND